ncbi:hypothetical protein [Collimonas silvisoli]|uniref:hypothetical protein n=1 Tax=Collimonas silvisoli TaxID=2825884 RepID=UPI001E63C4EE|nr:hypothetical protein [Collimonas silvisoli]
MTENSASTFTASGHRERRPGAVKLVYLHERDMFDKKIIAASIDETEYRLIVAEFDLLWSRATTPQEQSRMENMIKLINAFENLDNREKLGRRQK